MVGSEGSLLAAYGQLMKRYKDLTILQSAAGIIGWDMETKMPPKGIGLRSQQLALLESIGHKMMTDPKIGELLKSIGGDPKFKSLDAVQKRNIHLAKKAYDEATRLPNQLVTDIARQQAVATDVWKKAKAAKDYGMFRPELEKLFELKRKAAELLMEVKGTKTPYDALIDIYEPSMTAAVLSRVFRELRSGLKRITDKCVSSGQPDASVLERRVPIDVQRRIAEAIAAFIGYDIVSKNAGGRIDETEHPFTTGYYDDVRVTTHYHEDRFASSVFSVLHEGGHALYEQDLPREWMYQPVGSGCSMGIHESQSRFVENIVGRSTEFLGYFLPRLKELTGGALSDVALDGFVRAVNRVEPSKIRIEADEVTYGLHIIVRFELERDLFAGKVTVGELPQAWNEKYMEHLGVEVQDDSEGVMQDTHWAGGSFGYFPSYALGNLYGGQMLVTMEKDLPDWRKRVASGSFSEVKGWLAEHVHRYGNLHDPADLIKIISGEELTNGPFLRYLDDKFSRLYGY
jgi:carboxypeptidase Taq